MKLYDPTLDLEIIDSIYRDELTQEKKLALAFKMHAETALHDLPLGVRSILKDLPKPVLSELGKIDDEEQIRATAIRVFEDGDGEETWLRLVREAVEEMSEEKT